MFFEPFFILFNGASWSTYPSMPREAALKRIKKSFKNHLLRTEG